MPRLVTALTAAYLYLNTGAHDIVLSVAAMARTSARERRTPAQCANMLPLRCTSSRATRSTICAARRTAR